MFYKEWLATKQMVTTRMDFGTLPQWTWQRQKGHCQTYDYISTDNQHDDEGVPGLDDQVPWPCEAPCTDGLDAHIHH